MSIVIVVSVNDTGSFSRFKQRIMSKARGIAVTNLVGILRSKRTASFALVVKASVSRAEVPGFESRLPVPSKLALQWLPCQAPGVRGSVLGLVGPMSVYCDWVRWRVGSATSVSVRQHVELSEQVRLWDTLACCLDVKQLSNNNNAQSGTAGRWDRLHGSVYGNTGSRPYFYLFLNSCCLIPNRHDHGRILEAGDKQTSTKELSSFFCPQVHATFNNKENVLRCVSQRQAKPHSVRGVTNYVSYKLAV